MLTREEVRRLALEAKGHLGLTWPLLGAAVGSSPVYAALLDLAVDIRKIEEPAGVPRMVLSLDGKWLQYKKF
jgi:cyanate lyase